MKKPTANNLVFNFFSGRREEVQKWVMKLSDKEKKKFRKALNNNTIYNNLLINNK